MLQNEWVQMEEGGPLKSWPPPWPPFTKSWRRPCVYGPNEIAEK